MNAYVFFDTRLGCFEAMKKEGNLDSGVVGKITKGAKAFHTEFMTLKYLWPIWTRFP